MKEIALTAEQVAAVEIGGPEMDTCVTAGPGSGKTTVLVERFRRLAEAGDPLRVLAITFTEKAAANLRKKVAEHYAHDADRLAQLERAWISTVHGFCLRILKENAVFAAVDPEFRVTDEWESRRMRRRCAADAIESLYRERPAAARELAIGIACADLCEAMLPAYEAMRGSGVRVESLGAAAPPPDSISKTPR